MCACWANHLQRLSADGTKGVMLYLTIAHELAHYECHNSLDPDKDRCYVWPDLGPNCLQRLSAGDTSRHRHSADVTICVLMNCLYP